MLAVYPDADSLACAAAELFVSQFQKREASSQSFSVVLSGGTTPQRTYQVLAEDPFKSKVDWNCVHIFWGDERCVPSDDSRSNYRMAYETFLSKVAIPAPQIHPIRFIDNPNRSAQDYESLLRNYFGNSSPSFDLVFLGLGKDGHTASLFPGSPALKETERWAVAVRNDNEAFDRVTLTLPVLNRARMAVFLVQGEEKAEMLKKILSSTGTSPPLPAELIQPRERQLRWIVDSSAHQEMQARESF